MAIAFYIPIVDDEAENQRLLMQQQLVMHRQNLIQQQHNLNAQIELLQQQQQHLAQQSTILVDMFVASGNSGYAANVAQPSTNAAVPAGPAPAGAIASAPSTTAEPSTVESQQFYAHRTMLNEIRQILNSNTACSQCTLTNKLFELLRRSN